MKDKRGFGSLKAYFLIINLVVAMLAFSWMIGEVSAELPSSLPTASGGAGFEKGELYMKIDNDGVERIVQWKGTDESGIAKGLTEAGKEITWTALPDNEVETVTLLDLGKKYFGSLKPTGTVTIEGELISKASINPDKYDELGISKVEDTSKGGLKVFLEKGGFEEYSAAGKLLKTSGGLGWTAGTEEYLKNGLVDDFKEIAVWTGLGATVGGLVGGSKGAAWGGIGGLSGSIAKGLASFVYGTEGVFGLEWLSPSLFGLIVTAAVIAILYRDESIKKVEFNCLPYQPPIGGDDCEKCNEAEECTEYTCKSLGQACDLVDAGTENQKCVWKNPRDVNSPIMSIKSVAENHRFKPDPNARPAGNGVIISRTDQECIRAFTPLEFTLTTDEPAQCKVDYNLSRGFDEMSYFVGGESYFNYNHTEKLSLPGPAAINKIAPELQNDGTYTLFVRCRDANGNFNQDPFSVRFCVEKGPDTTPPRVENVNVPSGSPIQFNTSSLDIEVYVNEPSECKWSREDRSYDSMENTMDCDTNLWEMNNFNVYTCRTTLTGIENREENEYYFKCKDQPGSAESDRNTNVQSFLYTLIGTQPLTILEITPFNETIAGSTDAVPVTIEIKTDNGYEDGQATCYYSLTDNEEDYIEFLETRTNQHKQRQDLTTGNYIYFIKCVDLGGNTAYDFTSFGVESDKSGPVVVRVYKESGDLKIITSEKSECSYSFVDCNFDIEDGIRMTSLNYVGHNAEWKINKEYYVRCKDQYENQPNPNTCSIVVKLYKSDSGSDVIEL